MASASASLSWVTAPGGASPGPEGPLLGVGLAGDDAQGQVANAQTGLTVGCATASGAGRIASADAPRWRRASRLRPVELRRGRPRQNRVMVTAASIPCPVKYAGSPLRSRKPARRSATPRPPARRATGSGAPPPHAVQLPAAEPGQQRGVLSLAINNGAPGRRGNYGISRPSSGGIYVESGHIYLRGTACGRVSR